jgi:diguanylate cyclase (GGDEF)-like protein
MEGLLPLGPVALVGTPLGPALLAALCALPALLVLWLLSLVRTISEGRRLRGRALRMALAAELAVSPRDLIGMKMDSLLKLRDQVTFDELTGVLRRVAGIASSEREVSRARRQRSRLSAVFVDVDDLKQTNDSKGHAAGDALLKGVTSVLVGRLRGNDLIFRYGGDEFVCLLPEASGEDADRKLREIQADAASRGFSFTFGVAELGKHDDVMSLMGRADSALYERKRERRPDESGGERLIRLPGARRRRQPRPAES